MKQCLVVLLLLFTGFGLTVFHPQEKLATFPLLNNGMIELENLIGQQIQTDYEIGYLYKGYQIKFTEPFEICYFIFTNGNVLRMTNNLETSVRPLDNLDSIVETLGGYEEILVVIHNHFSRPVFSEGDQKIYRMLKQRGFNGRFQLYFSPTGKVYELHIK